MDDKSKKRKANNNNDLEPPKKKIYYYGQDYTYNGIFNGYIDDYETEYKTESDSETDSDDEKELVNIEKNIETLSDLIELGKQYDKTKRYNFNMKILNEMIPSMTTINEMIGLTNIKDNLVDHIVYYLQSNDLNNGKDNTDYMHCIVTGPPGVGKTEFAKALSKLFLAMKILKNDKFKKVKRSDLIAKYLGQTSHRTKDLIESCLGGVMFIDEVYSLGNANSQDSYAKEAIDTLNEYLSEHKNDFICIVAGYKNDVERCFLDYNQGLRSRFPLRFHIDGYDYKELFKIFQQKIELINWKLQNTITEKYFYDKMDYLKYYGRDIENLITQIKRVHSRRVFTLNKNLKTVITKEDLDNGFNNFKKMKGNNETKNKLQDIMYI